MSESTCATPPGMDDPKPLWPKFLLLITVCLWLLAWELIVWFVPVQPRLAIRTSDYLAGFSPDGGTLVTAVQRDRYLTGQIRLWDLKTGRDLGLIGEEGTNLLPNVVYLPQRNLLSEGAFSAEHVPAFHPRMTFVLFDLAARQETGSIQVQRDGARFPGADDGVKTLCFSADGRTLACCTYVQDEGEFKLVDVATGKVRAHFKGGQYGDASFSQDGGTLAITETKRSNPDVNFLYDRIVIVLDAATGERRWILQDYEKWASHLTFSPDGTMLAMCDWHQSRNG
jgi:WD40 repeat protein